METKEKPTAQEENIYCTRNSSKNGSWGLAVSLQTWELDSTLPGWILTQDHNKTHSQTKKAISLKGYSHAKGRAGRGDWWTLSTRSREHSFENWRQRTLSRKQAERIQCSRVLLQKQNKNKKPKQNQMLMGAHQPTGNNSRWAPRL